MSTYLKKMARHASAASLLGLAGAFAMAPAVQAAPVVELCLAVDSSGSISDEDWRKQIDAYLDALRDDTVVPQTGAVAVSIVPFSTFSQVSLPMTEVTSANVAGVITDRLTALRSARPYSTETAIGDAIAQCVRTFTADSSAKRLIDVSTDGVNNEGRDPELAANEAVNLARVSAINLLGIGDEVKQGEAELKKIARPGPAKQMGEGPGFVKIVDEWSQFKDALRAKLQAELGTPGLEVRKTNLRDSVTPGESLTYTVTITNTGDAATGVSWTDTFTGLDVTGITGSASPNSNAGNCTPTGCTDITVAAGSGSVSYTVTATVTGDAGTKAKNTATVTGGNCSATAPCVAVDEDPIVDPTTPTPKPPTPPTPGAVTPVPTTSPEGLAALALMVVGVAGWAARRRGQGGRRGK